MAREKKVSDYCAGIPLHEVEALNCVLLTPRFISSISCFL